MGFILTYEKRPRSESWGADGAKTLRSSGSTSRIISTRASCRQNRAKGEQKVEDEMLAAGPLPTEDDPNPESFNTLVDHPHAEVHKAK